MLLLGLLLAAAAQATPPPASWLDQLKTIATVRSTPMCSALHERVGPAIASIIDNDTKIASSGPIFGSMYHDDVITRSGLRMSFDVMRMENLITPIARNISSAQSQLSHLPKDPDLDAVRAQLQDLLDRQNDALNVISGFVDTYQMGELQGRTSTVPRSGGRAAQKPATGATNLLNAGLPVSPGSPKTAAEDSSNVYGGSSPYGSFAMQVSTFRKNQDAAEKAASELVSAAVDRCVVTPSTP
ncbi:MAG TPA: hypothetical protein VIO32_02065 [Candidatus Baltobacteraceae bacterium]